jgi:hypothetical protein
MKKIGSPLNLDERTKLIALKVMAVMYIITVVYLQAVVIYRQFALGQSIYDFEDIAIIMTANSLFLISALLYYGAIPIQKLKIKTILAGYGAIIVLGSLFTYAKYNIFQSPGLSFQELFDKLIIIFAVSGLIVLFFIIFSILGKRKLEKELGED